MPSKIINTMNQLIRADLTAAEINAAARGFVAFSLAKLQGQRVKLHGLIWGIALGAAVDRAEANLIISLQKGLIVNQQTSFPDVEDPSQMIFQFMHDLATSNPVPWFPAQPLFLEPGDSYALFMTIATRVPFTAPASLVMTVFGTSEAAVADDFTVNL